MTYTPLQNLYLLSSCMALTPVYFLKALIMTDIVCYSPQMIIINYDMELKSLCDLHNL